MLYIASATDGGLRRILKYLCRPRFERPNPPTPFPTREGGEFNNNSNQILKIIPPLRDKQFSAYPPIKKEFSTLSPIKKGSSTLSPPVGGDGGGGGVGGGRERARGRGQNF